MLIRNKINRRGFLAGAAALISQQALAAGFSGSVTPQVGGGLGSGFDGGLGGNGSWAPLSGSSIDLFFAQGSYFGVTGAPTAFLTTTRASQAYANDSAGNWISFATGIPRITNLGLLMEEARTNSIRNNSMQGAVPGTPGTPPTNWSGFAIAGGTSTIVGIGTINGIDYIDVQITGTPNGVVAWEFDTDTQIAAVTAQVWSGSVFVGIVGGTDPGITWQQAIREYTSGGAFVTQSSPSFTPSSTFTRFSQSPTLSGGVTTAFVNLGLRVTFPGVSTNITLRIGWPQLELGASVTSPIRTTAAAVTRAVDVITLTSPPAFGAAYSMFAKGTPQSPNAYSANQTLFQIDTGNDTQRSVLRRQGTFGRMLFACVGGTGINNSPVTVFNPNVSTKWAAALAANDQQLYTDSVAASANTAASLPTTPTSVRLGSGATEQWDGFVERVALWPTTRITNAQLQAITT